MANDLSPMMSAYFRPFKTEHERDKKIANFIATFCYNCTLWAVYWYEKSAVHLVAKWLWFWSPVERVVPFWLHGGCTIDGPGWFRAGLIMASTLQLAIFHCLLCIFRLYVIMHVSGLIILIVFVSFYVFCVVYAHYRKYAGLFVFLLLWSVCSWWSLADVSYLWQLLDYSV